MLHLLGAEGCGDRLAFSPECDFCGVVVDNFTLLEKLVDPVPPNGERDLEAFDTVGEAEKVVEDLNYLVCSWCRDTCPQKWFGCREAGQHSAKACRGDVPRVPVVQSRGVGEQEDHLYPEFFLTECWIRGTQRIPQVDME